MPADAVSLALIVDDPDAPVGTFTHWLARGISPDDGGLAEGQRAPREGRNDFREIAYRGPCPPRGDGSHRYFFRLCALAREPAVSSGASRGELERALKDNVLAVAELVRTYERVERRLLQRLLESLRSCAQPQPRTAPRTPPAGQRREPRARAVTPSSARRPPSEPRRRRTGPAGARPLGRQRCGGAAARGGQLPRSLAGRSTSVELNATPGRDPRLADAGSWLAEQLRFPTVSDTVTCCAMATFNRTGKLSRMSPVGRCARRAGSDDRP